MSVYVDDPISERDGPTLEEKDAAEQREPYRSCPSCGCESEPGEKESGTCT